LGPLVFQEIPGLVGKPAKEQQKDEVREALNNPTKIVE
jgi:hypothetical protein